MSEDRRRSWIEMLEELKGILDQYRPSRAVHIRTKDDYDIPVESIDEIGADFVEITLPSAHVGLDSIESRVIRSCDIAWIQKDQRFFSKEEG